jgi:hypothetical protein
MLAAWERSGLTMAAFCRERGLRPKRLYWWRRRLSQWSEETPSARKALGDAAAGAGLVEAVLVPSTSARSTALTL